MGRIVYILVFLSLLAVAGAITVSLQQNSFLGGEISPLMQLRQDSAQFNAGCRTIENALVLGVGALARRPGTTYVTATSGDSNARLEPFVYDETDAYVLEFTDGKLRFFRSTGIVLSTDDPTSDPYEVNTPFDGNEIFDLQTYQSADTMYIVHGDHLPQVLTRTDHNDWSIEDINALNGPFRNPNTTTTTVTLDDVNGTGVTMDADAAIFEANDVNALWMISHVMGSQADQGTCTSTEDNNEVVCGIGASYKFDFSATAFKGTIALQISRDEGETWENIYTATNADSTSMDVNDTGLSDFDENVLMRVSCTAFTSGSVDFTLGVDSYIHAGIVRITDFNDNNEVTVEVLDRIGMSNSATTRWREGAWSVKWGYPEAITGHFGRIVYAKDLTIWWSAVDDFENFYPGVDDDQAFAWTLSLARQNPIRWMVGERTQNITVGTLGKVMQLRSMDELSGFTPTNPPKVSSASAIPCGRIYPAIAETAVLFADRTGKRLHELVYDTGQETIVGPDLTKLADHITGTGIKQMAFQSSPYQILWCVRTDGVMATMSYSRDYGVAAWSRQITDGDYTSVCVVPTSGGPDRVWTVVYRNGHYYIEYFHDIDLDASIQDAYYVDSGLSWNGGAAVDINTITKANPGQVTLESWPAGLTDGDNIKIAGVLGMTQINTGPSDGVYTADDCNSVALTLTLDNVTGSANFNTTSYSTYTSGGTLQIVENTFAGLDHLEANTVDMLTDGAYDGNAVVDSNSITTNEFVNIIHVGLPYTTTVIPIEVDYQGQSGSTAPYGKRVTGLAVSIYRTAGFKYGASTSKLRSFAFPRVADGTTLQQVADLKSETVVLDGFGGPRVTSLCVIRQTDPLPLIIRAVIPILEVQPR